MFQTVRRWVSRSEQLANTTPACGRLIVHSFAALNYSLSTVSRWVVFGGEGRDTSYPPLSPIRYLVTECLPLHDDPSLVRTFRIRCFLSWCREPMGNLDLLLELHVATLRCFVACPFRLIIVSRWVKRSPLVFVCGSGMEPCTLQRPCHPSFALPVGRRIAWHCVCTLQRPCQPTSRPEKAQSHFWNQAIVRTECLARFLHQHHLAGTDD